MRSALLIISIAVPAVVACNGGKRDWSQLRDTADEAELTLIQAVDRAMVGRAGAPVRGALLVGGDPVFEVGVVAAQDREDVRIHIVSGDVLSVAPVGPAAAPCPDAIPLTQALGIAEQRAGGEAVAVVPDDDVACAFEIQVLVDSTLWEVKVAGDGRVLEYELSDEYTGAED